MNIQAYKHVSERRHNNNIQVCACV